MNILHIESSIFAENGVSSQLSHNLIEQLLQKHPSARITTRSFATQPVPHFDGERMSALSTPPEQRSDLQKELAIESDTLINEVKDADILVIGVPMYNFSVPSMLKAWFDHIARAGVTFQYTNNGPEGLLKNKKAFVVTTRGGAYKDTPNDTQTPFVNIFLNFIGIEDIEVIYAEKLNMGDGHRDASISSANQQIEQLALA